MESLRANNPTVALPVMGSGGEGHGSRVDKEAEKGATRSRWPLVQFAALVMIVSVLFTGSVVAWPLILKSSMSNDHYAMLAYNLVHGNLTVDGLTSPMDWVPWNGHKYLPLGPLPGIILIPFLPLFEIGVRTIWVGHIFTLLNVWLFYRVMKRLNIGDEQLKWSMLLFFGGTVYMGLAFVGSAWYFAQIVTVTLLMAAVLETLSARRPFVVGLLLGLAGMTRFTVMFALPFFLVMLLKKSGESGEGGRVSSVKRLVGGAGLVAAGLAGPIILLGLYNYARFGNPLDSGYAMAVLTEPVLEDARRQGLFSLAHVPKNLFMMLFQGPLPFPSEDAPVLKFPYMHPSLWGMGLLYTSPGLLYAFRAKLREPFVWASWLAVLCVMVPIITYYGVGWQQFGYRYALDFIPFLTLLAARGMPNPMNNAARGLVILSLLVNLWGCTFLATWGFK